MSYGEKSTHDVIHMTVKNQLYLMIFVRLIVVANSIANSQILPFNSHFLAVPSSQNAIVG